MERRSGAASAGIRFDSPSSSICPPVGMTPIFKARSKNATSILLIPIGLDLHVPTASPRLLISFPTTPWVSVGHVRLGRESYVPLELINSNRDAEAFAGTSADKGSLSGDGSLSACGRRAARRSLLSRNNYLR